MMRDWELGRGGMQLPHPTIPERGGALFGGMRNGRAAQAGVCAEAAPRPGACGHNLVPGATEAELTGAHCYCGQFGCIETWISGTGLARDHANVNPPDSGRKLSGPEIVAAAEAGDAAAEASMVRLEGRIARS